MFYADPSVLYVSVHQSPFYPGTGAVDEQGEGEGRGFSVNVPLSAGADDTVYDAAFERLIAPVAELYKPGLLLLSAGFDAHLRDPLAGMRVSESGYAAMIDRLIGAVDKGVPIGLVLEGGYDLQGLESSLRRTVEALFAGPGEQSPGRIGPRHEQELAQAVLAAKNYWKLG
jgi:acetoin utilization deacetylase AcuC-like enzyme